MAPLSPEVRAVREERQREAERRRAQAQRRHANVRRAKRRCDLAYHRRWVERLVRYARRRLGRGKRLSRRVRDALARVRGGCVV
jgi:hypothetical protein